MQKRVLIVAVSVGVIVLSIGFAAYRLRRDSTLVERINADAVSARSEASLRPLAELTTDQIAGAFTARFTEADELFSTERARRWAAEKSAEIDAEVPPPPSEAAQDAAREQLPGQIAEFLKVAFDPDTTADEYINVRREMGARFLTPDEFARDYAGSMREYASQAADSPVPEDASPEEMFRLVWSEFRTELPVMNGMIESIGLDRGLNIQLSTQTQQGLLLEYDERQARGGGAKEQWDSVRTQRATMWMVSDERLGITQTDPPPYFWQVYARIISGRGSGVPTSLNLVFVWDPGSSRWHLSAVSYSVNAQDTVPYSMVL